MPPGVRLGLAAQWQGVHFMLSLYKLPSLLCPVCGATTRATLPVGVPPRGFGPCVQATVALYTEVYYLSKRTTQDILHDLCGIATRLGTITHDYITQSCQG
jgi:hypothetical protein